LFFIATCFCAWTEPVTEHYDEEDENERMLPVTMVTTSAVFTRTTGAVRYAVAMTASSHPLRRNPSVVDIELLEPGLFSNSVDDCMPFLYSVIQNGPEKLACLPN